MRNSLTKYQITIFILLVLGLPIAFLTFVNWYLGFICIPFSLAALFLSVFGKKNFDQNTRHKFTKISVCVLMISLLLIGTQVIKTFVTDTFIYQEKEYNYNSSIISLSVFVIMIGVFVWDRLPMATTAILGCSLMVVLGLCSFSTAFGQFASSTVILTIGVMIVGAAIAETGLANLIGNWIIKISKGSEKTLIVGTYLVSALMSAFLTNSAVLAIFIPIIVGLSKNNSSIKAKNLIMPIAIGCVLGGASTLVGSTQQMTAQGLLEESGLRTFKTFDFLPLVGIIILLGLFYIIFYAYKKGQKIWNEDKIDIDVRTNETENKPKWRMILVLIIFLITVLFYITEWVPLAITSTTAALLCIITGCINQKKAISSVNWDIVGRLGGCLGLAKALEVAGGTALLSKELLNIFNGSSTYLNPQFRAFLLFVFFTLLVLVLSHFISNSTAILIVLPIVFAIAPQLGLNTYTFALGITISSGICLSCPLASSTLGMSMVVGYKFKDYFSYSLLFNVISYIFLIISVPLFYGLLQ